MNATMTRRRWMPLVLALLGASAAVACKQAEGPTPMTPRSTEPRLDVRRADGVPPDRVARMFRPALEPMQRCLGGSGGKLEVLATSRDGGLDLTVLPGASLDPTTRKCALDALTSVYLSETGSNVGGPGIPPSGFTSHLTVTW